LGSAEPDAAWRAEMMADVRGEDVARATEALLSLTNHEPDRGWIEAVLLDVIDSSLDQQVRQLAVICLGHIARIHGAISERVIRKLETLENVSEFTSRARNALEEIEMFAK
jgi:hypothetical protein